MEARSGAINTIEFPHFLDAYEPLRAIPNIRLFIRQARAFRLFIRNTSPRLKRSEDQQTTQALGQCFAIIAYAQLIAENAKCLDVPPQMVSAIFHGLVTDLSICALNLASLPSLRPIDRLLIRRVITVPRTSASDWDFVAERCRATK